MTVDESVEAERLRHVRALIEELLREADVCAHVVLAGRGGRFENFSFFGAKWSNVRESQTPDGRTFLGLRSRHEDYGSPDEQRAHLEWSVGAVSGIAQILGVTAISWIEATEQFEKATGAEHTPWKRDDPRDN